MKRFLIAAAIAVALAACGHKAGVVKQYKPGDYQWHKQTNFIKVHWNYVQHDSDAIIAEGFVEPFNPGNGVFMVRLKLVGLDDKGGIVSSAEGMPKDNDIISPMTPKSPFTIKMRPTGREAEFTITGSYYHYQAGDMQRVGSSFLDYIPVRSDEP
jgi:opacity protein-like surface antigen